MKCFSVLAFVLMTGSAWAGPTEVPSHQSPPEVPAAAGQSETLEVPEPQGALINAKDRRHQVSTACRKDRERFCPEIKGAAKIKKCLAAHSDQLSKECRAITKAH